MQTNNSATQHFKYTEYQNILYYTAKTQQQHGRTIAQLGPTGIVIIILFKKLLINYWSKKVCNEINDFFIGFINWWYFWPSETNWSIRKSEHASRQLQMAT